MDNGVTLITLGTQNTIRKQTKHINTPQHRVKKMSNMDPHQDPGVNADARALGSYAHEGNGYRALGSHAYEGNGYRALSSHTYEGNGYRYCIGLYDFTIRFRNCFHRVIIIM
jgi:hypothetical protein